MSGLVSGDAKQFRSRGKESPRKERRLPLPLAPVHVRLARWLQWCFYFSRSGPTPLPNLLPGTLPTTNSHSSPSSACGFSRSGCSLKTQKKNVPENQTLAKDRSNYYGGLVTLHVALIIDMGEFYLRRSCRSQRGVECGGESDC